MQYLFQLFPVAGLTKTADEAQKDPILSNFSSIDTKRIAKNLETCPKNST